ncbi:MAG: glycosyltransferase [Oscillospiraceae bacterium]|nr:glycosyltransferase [Oscillospiraceae bacterium]MCL2279541.1 glycosyltransferase [Oscillospiraceae bacterium]
MLVSVIIPTYNRIDETCKLIDSLLVSDYKDIEIIIADNNSDDGTVTAINDNYVKNGHPVVVVALERNMMASGGRNAGIKVAKGDYYLFVDSDNVVTPNMISELVKSFTDGVGFVAPAIINAQTSKDVCLAGGDYNFLTSRPIRISVDETDREKVLYETCYCENAFMISKDVMQRVGGFESIYFIMYEESDLGYRIKSLGYRMYINKNAITHHYPAMKSHFSKKLRSLGIETPERAYHFAKNRTLFMKKFAPWYYMPTYYLFFAHLACAYYMMASIMEKRFNVALSYLKGTWKGFFMKVNKSLYIEI